MDTIRKMQLLVALSELGSLSAVARDWGMAPSTVTQGLKELEAELGTQLVTRTTRQLSFTAEGRDFLDRSRRLLADFEETMTDFSKRGPLSGQLRVTSSNDVGRSQIVGLIDRFMVDHPGLSVQLYLSDRVIDIVESGFDVGIRTGPLRDSDLRARMLLRGHKCICAAPVYWRRHGKPQYPKQLGTHNCLILGAPGDTHSYWIFTEHGKRTRVRVSGNRQANDGQTLRDWAIAGAGVVQKSSFDVAADIAAGRLETALEGFTTESTNLYAVSPPRVFEARRVRAFLDYVSDNLTD